MTDDLQLSVSVITEMNEVRSGGLLRAFARSVCWGAFAGGSLFLLVSVPAAIATAIEGYPASAVAVALYPLAISGIVTLAGMLVIGLPLTAILHQLQREQRGMYEVTGLLAGLALPMLIMVLTLGFRAEVVPIGLFLGMFGAIAGSVTGRVWGDWRERVVGREQQP